MRNIRTLLVVYASALAVAGAVACTADQSPSPTTASPPPPSQPSITITMPNLVGLFWTDAYPRLRDAGWDGVLHKLPEVPVAPEQRYRVVTQAPPAGEPVQSDGQITLAFGS